MRTLSVGRWMFLLTLAVVMLVYASQVNSVPHTALPCCSESSNYTVRRITQCFKQVQRHGCDHDAFLIINRKGTFCINAAAKWLQDKINNGELKCPPDVGVS